MCLSAYIVSVIKNPTFEDGVSNESYENMRLLELEYRMKSNH